jgi:2-oxoglutarate ferredoxin oxidoreductase subunit beta
MENGKKKPTLPPGVQKTRTLPGSGNAPTLPPGSGKAPTLPPGVGGKPSARPPDGIPGGLPVGLPAGGDGAPAGLTRKDFETDQDVRWCPGCGDYAILATMQRLMPELGVAREKTVFVSGIGCSSRFPYYMNTYGVHSIHGRAPAVATGLKSARPDLDVWVITGDGDALSIGGNHLIHLLRRNVNLQLLLFNNQIYGLTKGQYSPTSEAGKVTKSTPYGSIDHPFNPIALALGADATFVARTMDRDPKHMKDILKRAHDHKGASFVEIYQNCNIFNDGAFFVFTEKDSKPEHAIFVESGKPLIYNNGLRGLRLEGYHLVSVELGPDFSADDCLVYNSASRELAGIVGRLFMEPDLPQPFGVFYQVARGTYDDLLHAQIEGVVARKGVGDLRTLLASGDTWTIE